MSVVHTIRRLATFLAVAAAACAVAPAAELPETPIATGVVVRGVEIGGMTSVVARRELRAAVARPLRLTDGDRTFLFYPTRPVRFDVDAAVRDALRATPGDELSVPLEIDRGRLTAYVRMLANRLDRPARDARLVGLSKQLRPVITPARTGRTVRQQELVRALAKALRAGDGAEIAIPVSPVRPRVTALGPIVVIQRESNRLDLFDQRKLVRTFRVATGTSQYPTPLGRFRLVDKQYHPWWYPPPSDWARGLKPVPPGPGNPLGTRWMGLDVFGVGIHGTPSSSSIGYPASHGCIRMHIWEAEWLFERVRLGTPVFVVSA